jgi:sec-independent protein translocase protein TatA
MFAFLPSLGPTELIVLLGLGVLLFGRKLPDIAKSLGKSVVSFKQGFNGLEEEISSGGSSAKAIEPEPVRPPQRVTPSSPVFSDAAPATNLPPKI